MKKYFFIVMAGLCFCLGLMFVIVPGPSLIFFIAGLFLLSFYYPKARDYLSHCQRLLKVSCQQLDKFFKR